MGSTSVRDWTPADLGELMLLCFSPKSNERLRQQRTVVCPDTKRPPENRQGGEEERGEERGQAGEEGEAMMFKDNT